MDDLVTLELPREASAALADIRQAIAKMDGVEDSGELTTRALDPVSIGLWVHLATQMGGAATALTGVLSSIFGLVRQKGIKNATFKYGDTVVELSNVSVEEFDKIVKSLQKLPRKG